MDTTHRNELALGTIWFGTRQDETTAFALLDHYVARGGRWLDTSDNYAFWESPTGHGGASETVIGRWLRRNPGIREHISISTKVGANPTVPGTWDAPMEGLGLRAVEEALASSMARLGVDVIDLLWAHIEDRAAPLEEQVEAFGSLVAEGRVRRLGASNHATWRVERARALARTRGLASYDAIQLRHSYLQAIPFVPLPSGHMAATAESLDYAAAEGLGMWAYTTLLSGAYARPERLPHAYRHPGTERRLAALDRVAQRLDATRNQVVLAWLIRGTPAVTPIVGVSDIAQLDEAMDALALPLDAEARAVLDGRDAQ